LDSAFITRSLRMSVALAAFAFLFTSVYVDVSWGLGVLLGALWGTANLYLIKFIIEQLVSPNRTLSTGVILIAIVKFPLLYVLGYLIISRPWYDPLAPLLGFLIPFAVIVLKAAGRMLLGLQGPDPGRKTMRAFLKR
jgi:hypothetical protein